MVAADHRTIWLLCALRAVVLKPDFLPESFMKDYKDTDSWVPSCFHESESLMMGRTWEFYNCLS